MIKEEELKVLIKQIQNSDERAFEELFNIFYPRFYRYAFLYLKSDVLCEELVSDVFLKLWNVREKLGKIKQLDYYMFRSVKNQVFTYLKKKNIEHVELTEFISSHLVDYQQPDQYIISEELADRIKLIVSKLPDRCKTVYQMVKEDGLSYQQVADLLDISIKTVENQMNKALKRLREAVQQYYNNPGLRNRFLLLFF